MDKYGIVVCSKCRSTNIGLAYIDELDKTATVNKTGQTVPVDEVKRAGPRVTTYRCYDCSKLTVLHE